MQSCFLCSTRSTRARSRPLCLRLQTTATASRLRLLTWTAMGFRLRSALTLSARSRSAPRFSPRRASRRRWRASLRRRPETVRTTALMPPSGSTCGRRIVIGIRSSRARGLIMGRLEAGPLLPTTTRIPRHVWAALLLLPSRTTSALLPTVRRPRPLFSSRSERTRTRTTSASCALSLRRGRWTRSLHASTSAGGAPAKPSSVGSLAATARRFSRSRGLALVAPRSFALRASTLTAEVPRVDPRGGCRRA
eukprot:Amastigsp_a510583_15.p3 type:complete len:250 gc:universal Amastigsp_a510583_15:851-102(-)